MPAMGAHGHPMHAGMNNVAYCNWIMNPMNWGGGIELAILAKHYGREIAAWNIESKKPSVFGEEKGYPRHVMVCMREGRGKGTCKGGGGALRQACNRYQPIALTERAVVAGSWCPAAAGMPGAGVCHRPHPKTLRLHLPSCASPSPPSSAPADHIHRDTL